MPTSYHVFSPVETKEMVKNEDFDSIDEYIKNPKTDFVECTGLPSYLGTFFNQPVVDDLIHLRVIAHHQIAIRAVQLNKPNVLHHIKDGIDFIYVPTGNSYELFHLATELGHYDLIKVLYEIAVDTTYGDKILPKIEFALRIALQMIKDDHELFRILREYYLGDDVYRLDLWNIYHYSIAWDRPGVTKWLLDHYSTNIDLSWTPGAIDIAKRFDSQKSLEFVKENEDIQRFLKDGENSNYVSNVLPPKTNLEVADDCTHQRVISDFSIGGYQWGWDCDLCSVSYPIGSDRWFCKTCHSDICLECDPILPFL